MSKLWFKLFELPFIGNRIKNKMVEKNGKAQESNMLREYTRERYGVDVGMYTYGGCFNSDFAWGDMQYRKILFNSF